MGAEVNVSLSMYSGSVPSMSSSTVNLNGLSAGTQSLTANGASAPSAVRSAPLQTNITPSNTSGQSQNMHCMTIVMQQSWQDFIRIVNL